MWYDEEINLVWHGVQPVNLPEVQDLVKQDMISCLSGLQKPSDLIFHTVFLSNNLDGEHVIIWGVSDDNMYFHCQWHETGDIDVTNVAE